MCWECRRDGQFPKRGCLVFEAQHAEISAPGGDCEVPKACPCAGADEIGVGDRVEARYRCKPDCGDDVRGGGGGAAAEGEDDTAAGSAGADDVDTEDGETYGALDRAALDDGLARAIELIAPLTPTLRAADVALARAQTRAKDAGELLTVAEARLHDANETLVGARPALTELATRAGALMKAWEQLTDEGNRKFYDKPCVPMFGACCARDQPDGGKSITCG